MMPIIWHWQGPNHKRKREAWFTSNFFSYFFLYFCRFMSWKQLLSCLDVLYHCPHTGDKCFLTDTYAAHKLVNLRSLIPQFLSKISLLKCKMRHASAIKSHLKYLSVQSDRQQRPNLVNSSVPRWRSVTQNFRDCPTGHTIMLII